MKELIHIVTFTCHAEYGATTRPINMIFNLYQEATATTGADEVKRSLLVGLYMHYRYNIDIHTHTHTNSTLNRTRECALTTTRKLARPRHSEIEELRATVSLDGFIGR